MSWHRIIKLKVVSQLLLAWIALCQLPLPIVHTHDEPLVNSYRYSDHLSWHHVAGDLPSEDEVHWHYILPWNSLSGHGPLDSVSPAAGDNLAPVEGSVRPVGDLERQPFSLVSVEQFHGSLTAWLDGKPVACAGCGVGCLAVPNYLQSYLAGDAISLLGVQLI